MCLGIPGQIVSIIDFNSLIKPALVRFGSLTKEVSLAYTPQANVGDYVLVHVGFAISIINEEEANAFLATLDALQGIENEIPS